MSSEIPSYMDTEAFWPVAFDRGTGIPVVGADRGTQRKVKSVWDIPIAHGCAWLPPNSPIPEEDRNRYISLRPIRAVIDPYDTQIAIRAVDNDLQKRSENAFIRYRQIAATYCQPRYQPIMRNWFDKARWELHKILLRWKVIL